MDSRFSPATFDSCGDISEQTYQEISEFVGCPKRWLDHCADCWNDTGVIRRFRSNESDEPGYEFVTGGCSGNELVIEAMQQNYVMWSLIWESSHRGGLHRFDFAGVDLASFSTPPTEDKRDEH